MHNPAPASHAVTRTTVWRGIAAVGVALLAVAVLLYGARVGNPRTWLVLATTGGASLMAAALANARTVVAFFRRRDARRGTDAALATLFMTAILVVVQAT